MAIETDPMIAYRSLLRRIQDESPPAETRTWRGSKILRVGFGGSFIDWMQHGRILDCSGEMIGTYERTREFAGPDGNEQTVIFFPLPGRSGFDASEGSSKEGGGDG